MDVHVSRPLGHMAFTSEGHIVVLDAGSERLMLIMRGVVLVAQSDIAECSSYGWNISVDHLTSRDEYEAGMVRVCKL